MDQRERARLVTFCDRGIEAGWLLAALLIPLLFNPLNNNVFELPKVALFRFLALLMLALLLAKLMAGGRYARCLSLSFWRALAHSNPLLIPASLLGLAYVFSNLTSIVPSISFWGSYPRVDGTYTFLALIAFFIITAHLLRRRDQVVRLLGAILLGSTLSSLYAILQGAGVYPFFEENIFGRGVFSTMGNPLFLGAYLVMVAPLTAACLAGVMRGEHAGGRGRWAKALALGVLLFLQLFALLLTTSRGPWLGMVAAAFLFLTLFAVREGKGLRLSLGLGFASLAFIIALNLPQGPLQGLREMTYLSRLGNLAETQSGTGKVRLLIWQGTLELIRIRPTIGSETGGSSLLRLLLGYGPESLREAFQAVYPPELGRLSSREEMVDRAHNWLLQDMATLGILGTGALLLLLAVVFREAWGWLWKSEERRDRLLIIALMSSIAGHLVETSFGVAVITTRLLFWLFLALLVALGRLSERSIPEDAPQKVSPVSGWFGLGFGLGGAFLLLFFGAYTNLNRVRADMEARRAGLQAEAENWVDAARFYAEANRLYPGEASYLEALAQVYLEVAQRTRDDGVREELLRLAERAIERAHSLEPLLAHHYARLGLLYAYWGETLAPEKFDKSLSAYARATRLSPHKPRYYNEWATTYLSLGAPAQALEKLEYSLTLDPEYAITHLLLGRAYAMQGQLQRAKEHYTLSLELDPTLEETQKGLMSPIGEPATSAR